MKKLFQSSILLLALAGLLVTPSLAQSDAGASRGEAGFEVSKETELKLIFAIPSERLAAEGNAITVNVHGDRGVLASNRFSDIRRPDGPSPDSHLVLVAFAENPRIRESIHAAAVKGQRVEIAIDVNGETHQRLTYDSVYEVSAKALAHGILPRVFHAEAVGPDGVDGGEGPFALIPVCGDGLCEGDAFPPETCATCPEDCGGPCNFCGDGFCTLGEGCENCEEDCGPCDDCPMDLPDDTVEILFFAGPTLGSDCWLDHVQPNRQVIYNRRSTLFLSFTVTRVLECDGTVTETIVPGTLEFICRDCWQRTEEQCNGPMDWAPPCTL